MTDDELLALLSDFESDAVERTSSFRDTDKLGEAACAFANDLPNHQRPGVLFIGVNNDGSCANIDITDQLLQNLAAIRSDGNLLPQPSITVEKRRVGGCEMAVILVQPASDTPVRYKGVVWIRVGPRRARASRLVSPDVDPLRFVPGAYIQFLRIDGRELTDPIRDHKTIDGPIPMLIEQVDDVLKAHNSVSSDFTSASTEIDSPEFPIVALQQIVRNAVMHRNYEGTSAPIRITWFTDRIEVNSPGGPYGNVTVSNFGQPGITDYRNRHLAEAMSNLGFVQRFGVGIALARREMQKNGNPQIEFEVNNSFILAILRAKRS